MFKLLASSLSTQHYNIPKAMYLILVLALVGYTVIEYLHTKKDHDIKIAEAFKWTFFYISLALAYGVLVFIFVGKQAGSEYLAAWAIEKALSLDNLFVIGLIFTSFKVPKNLERRMLNYGIAGAIIFRLIFILAGAQLLHKFEWVGIIFGLILLNSAYKAFKESKGGHEIEEEVQYADKKIWKLMKKVLPLKEEFNGHKLTIKEGGKKYLSLMFGIIVLIELTDLIFAVDSVPAVLAVSPSTFIAYSSNIFAILGLRALFFVYQAVAEKFWALSLSLAAVLFWIGFKLIAAPFGLHIPIWLSLTVLFICLGGGILISILKPRKLKVGHIKINS
jgi:tellurite resistance protein TerC